MELLLQQLFSLLSLYWNYIYIYMYTYTYIYICAYIEEKYKIIFQEKIYIIIILYRLFH